MNHQLDLPVDLETCVRQEIIVLNEAWANNYNYVFNHTIYPTTYLYLFPIFHEEPFEAKLKLNWSTIFKSFFEVYPPLPLPYFHNCTTLSASIYSNFPNCTTFLVSTIWSLSKKRLRILPSKSNKAFNYSLTLIYFRQIMVFFEQSALSRSLNIYMHTCSFGSSAFIEAQLIFVT